MKLASCCSNALLLGSKLSCSNARISRCCWLKMTLVNVFSSRIDLTMLTQSRFLRYLSSPPSTLLYLRIMLIEPIKKFGSKVVNLWQLFGWYFFLCLSSDLSFLMYSSSFLIFSFLVLFKSPSWITISELSLASSNFELKFVIWFLNSNSLIS